MVPNAMAVGVHPISIDLSLPSPSSFPPLVAPPVGCESEPVVLWGKAVGKELVEELDDSEVTEVSKPGGWPR